MLQIEGLTKYYGNTLGVRDIGLEVFPGEIFGFLAPDGSGKSTTVRCVMDLIRRTAGTVLVDGEPFDRRTPGRKALVGYLPAKPRLYAEMRVRDLIAWTGRYYPETDEKKLGGLLRRLGVDLSSPAGALSMADCRKTGLLMALIHAPKLLILDEPTDGLDARDKELVLDILREERARGTAVFLTSKSLSEVCRVCDRAAVVRGGEIVVTDEAKDLVTGTVQQVTLECADPGIAEKLGGRAVWHEGDTVRFLYEGTPERLLTSLETAEVRRMLVEEADLEEVLRHYFQ